MRATLATLVLLLCASTVQAQTDVTVSVPDAARTAARAELIEQRENAGDPWTALSLSEQADLVDAYLGVEILAFLQAKSNRAARVAALALDEALQAATRAQRLAAIQAARDSLARD
jgi:hypothetical protein